MTEVNLMNTLVVLGAWLVTYDFFYYLWHRMLLPGNI